MQYPSKSQFFQFVRTLFDNCGHLKGIVVLSGKGRKEREGNREEMEWLRIDNRRIDNGNNHSVNEMD